MIGSLKRGKESKTEYFYIVKANQKDGIIELIESNGYSIPNGIKSLSAVEILNHYKDYEGFEMVLNGLVHEEPVYDETMRELAYQLFDDNIEKIGMVEDYSSITSFK